MMQHSVPLSKSIYGYSVHFLGMAIGALLAAVSLRVFLVPNELIDGGIIGIALILGRLTSFDYLSLFILALNLPFIYLAYRSIRRMFVVYMLAATLLFILFLYLLHTPAIAFEADPLEAIVIGGAMLGAGAGMIIRHGGCTDGTEILAILINRKKGFTVGQVVLFINIFIFAIYGWIFQDWHIALRSFMTWIVAFKMMDIVIAGLEELKSVLIMCTKPEELSKIITHELGLGLTFIKGKGGYSGEDRDILFIIVERLDLAQLKEIVLHEDPSAFIAIENLHEVAYGRTARIALRRTARLSLTKRLIGGKPPHV
jgi:uncharacterized membrane-anchored protein YitT (DUF2179 family)